MGERNDDDSLIHHVLEEAEPAVRIPLVQECHLRFLVVLAGCRP